MQAVLVGHGSVGIKHLKNLKAISNKINIIDPISNSATFRSLDNFAKEFSKIKNVPDMQRIAVIANWGPDHLTATSKLFSLGFNRILIEKPMATNLAQIDEYENMIAQGLNAWCNYHLRFSIIMNTLHSFQNNNSLGSPKSISVVGGAKCLSTTGIHWIDLAVKLFNEIPLKIYGNVMNAKINPRNNQLSFLDGINFFRFSDNRTLTLNFNNYSQADATITILWEHFFAKIHSGKIQIFGANLENHNLLPITRTVNFDKLLIDERFFDEGFDILFKEFLISNSSLDQLFVANRALLLSLCSSHLERTIDWNESLSEDLIHHDWGIS
jgi:predicted dehydrogenase